MLSPSPLHPSPSESPGCAVRSARPFLACAQVDILSWRNKGQRVHAQIKDICAILSGLMVAQDYKRGQELIRDRDFKVWRTGACSVC